MTARQTAVAAAAELKWLVNSAAILRRRVRYNRQQAKWWGLVWVLTELGLSLRAAAAASTAALGEGDSSTRVTAAGDPSGSASVVVDLARYESIFLGNLSRALVHETPRRRGRPVQRGTKGDVLTTAQHYGIDLSLIRSAIERTPAERLALLEKNAAFVRDMRRRPA